MWMTLEIAGIGDADKLSLTKLLDVLSTAISHTCTETAYELIHNLIESTLVRNLCNDSFRNELLDVLFHILEVTVL